MALGLALASANVQMFDMPLAAAALFESRTSTRPILDPTDAQCERAKREGGRLGDGRLVARVHTGLRVFACMPQQFFRLQIGHVLSEGVLSVKQAHIATTVAFKASLILHDDINEALKASI